MSETRLIAELPGSFLIRADWDSGTILAKLNGFWSADVATHFMNEMAKAAKVARTQNGQARFLLDLSESPVQSMELFTLAEERGHFLRLGDRVALIVTSALLKMQLGRYERVTEHNFFTDRVTALEWLSAR